MWRVYRRKSDGISMAPNFHLFILIHCLIVMCPFSSSSEYDTSNGGWKLDNEVPVGLDGPCTVERVDAQTLTQEIFMEKYAESQPVIIYNYGRNALFRKRCQRDEMLQEWSTAKVVLNSANTYSYTRVDSTFGEYVNSILRPQNIDVPGNETLYLFGDIDQELWKPLLSVYKLPPWILPNHEPALSFGIAGAGTGVPFHFHGPGFGEAIYGSKRWFLQKYEHRPEFNPDKTTLSWYLTDYTRLSEKERPLECLLKPGELIYFPDKWWHATLNSETSVFISTFLSSTVKTSSSKRKNEL